MEEIKARENGEPDQGIKPFKCMVCMGKGKVDVGFYSQISEIMVPPLLRNFGELCRTCNGTGIIWF